MKLISSQLNSQLMPYFANAAREASEPDKEAVFALCKRLSAIESIKYMEVAKQVSDLEMPAGYIHVRLFEHTTLDEFASAWATEPNTLLTPAAIAMLVITSEPFLFNRWVLTSPLFDHPYQARGVLDLAVHFEPRPVPLGEFDID